MLWEMDMEKLVDVDRWEESKERYNAWWDGTLSGGPILKVFVTAPDRPSPGSTPEFYHIEPEWLAAAQREALAYGMSPAPYYVGLDNDASRESLSAYWLDVPSRLRLFQAAISNAVCLGDAFLHFFPDLGSTMAAIFVGSEPIFHNRSLLNEQLPVETLEQIEPYLEFDPHNRWWQTTLDLMRAAFGTLDGRAVVGLPNLGGALDILASLRGTQNLLMDLVLCPDAVKRVEARLSQLWIRFYDELYALTQKWGQEGTTSWTGVWSDGRSFPIQCDVAVMISPGMFQEFAVPSLRIQAAALDHCVFHYHREGARKALALDHLLDMDEIHAIQWTCEPGDPPLDDEAWLPAYRRITDRGKGLVLHEVQPDRVGWLVSNLPAERLAINVICESEEQAYRLLSRYGSG
jgi:hypothetical protein